MVNMLNSIFDKIYCINLDRRKDRWQKSKEQFDKLSIDVERFSAVEPVHGNTHLLKGELGVLLSNLRIIKDAISNKYNSIVIFEDDVEFHPDFTNLFENFIQQVPANWDMIYFGGNHVGGFNSTTENVVKLNGSYAIQSIVLRSTIFEAAINMLSLAEKQVDVYYAMLHRVYNAYCFMPHLTWQRPDFSDIQQGYVDYDFLRMY